MKVGGPGPISNTGGVKGGKVAGGDNGFSKFLDSASNEKEVGGTTGISKLAPINFIQTVDADEQSRRRKQLADEAEDILDELAKIRDALLFGRLSAQQLLAMQSKIARIEANCDDPKLNDIIEDVKTRAAVELAKLGY